MSHFVSSVAQPSACPWYRQRWPWLLMAGPAIVVIAGLVTAWLALSSDDGLIAEDYYKRGLLVNRDLEKTARAAGVGGHAVATAAGELQLTLTGLAERPPEVLRVRFANATRAGLDATIELRRAPDGRYVGALPALAPGRWLVSVQSEQWRLPTIETTTPVGELRFGAERGAADARVG